MKLLSIALITLGVSAAQAATYTGSYKVSSFRSVPATLNVSGSQNVTVKINAPAAGCVVSFGTGVYQGTVNDSWGTVAIYELPVIERCDAPRMGYRFRLNVRKDQSGKTTDVQVRGSNGKMSWTYFSN